MKDDEERKRREEEEEEKKRKKSTDSQTGKSHWTSIHTPELAGKVHAEAANTVLSGSVLCPDAESI